jgi:hypothetical protein
MRVLRAALFVVVGSCCAGVTLSTLVPTVGGWILGLGVGGVFLFLCVVADYLFNRPEDRLAEFRSPNSIMRDLETRGLLASTTFRATRAFEVEEYDDEGPHYFIELEDGSVLYLNGQYLLDYGPIDDDPEFNQPRLFPCTEFTIRRHRDEGYVVEIICGGSVLTPEVMAPAFDRGEYRHGAVPEDCQVLVDRKYEEIKRERMKTG